MSRPVPVASDFFPTRLHSLKEAVFFFYGTAPPCYSTSDMPLTAQQKVEIKKIMARYKREVRSIVVKHKKEITQAVENLDKQRADKIKKLIEQS